MSSFLFSCENATYAVPAELARLFTGHQEVLSGSEGWEPGALNLAQACAMRFRTPLVHTEISRLLLDVEAAKTQCWSRYSSDLDESTQRRLLERYWQTYRNLLHRRIHGDLQRHGHVFHILVHTDPNQRQHVKLQPAGESGLGADLAGDWLKTLRRNDLRCSMSAEDTATDLLRDLTQAYDPGHYAQIRLSVHQDFFMRATPWRWDTIKKHLLDSLAISSGHVRPLVAG